MPEETIRLVFGPDKRLDGVLGLYLACSLNRETKSKSRLWELGDMCWPESPLLLSTVMTQTASVGS